MSNPDVIVCTMDVNSLSFYYNPIYSFDFQLACGKKIETLVLRIRECISGSDEKQLRIDIFTYYSYFSVNFVIYYYI